MNAIFRLFKRKYDWRAMFLCILAASVFWFLNAMNGDHSADISYPVVYKYDPQELTSKSVSTTRVVRFHAYGEGWDLLKMKLSWLVEPIEIEVSTKRKFRYILTEDIKPYIEDKLSDIQIRYFLEDTLYTGLDKVKKVKMKIYVDREDLNLKEGYKIDGPIQISPEYVMASGPSSILDTLTKKIIIRVSEGNISDTYKDEISIPKPPHPLVDYDAENVTVSFRVTEHKRPFTE